MGFYPYIEELKLGHDMQPVEARPPEINIVVAWIARLILRIFGWRPVGVIPNIPRLVVIGAPHTSNWDGLLLLLTALSLRVKLFWLGKHTLFKNPLIGAVLRWLGGVPVDRTRRQNTVEQIVEAFHARERMILILAPDGSRKQMPHWKTGFYRIAEKAGAPLALAFVDYPRKVAGMGPVIYPTGDIEADMVAIREFYADKQGRHPERMSAMTLPPANQAEKIVENEH